MLVTRSLGDTQGRPSEAGASCAGPLDSGYRAVTGPHRGSDDAIHLTLLWRAAPHRYEDERVARYRRGPERPALQANRCKSY